MELIVRDRSPNLVESVYGERVYRMNFNPIFNPTHRQLSDYPAFSFDDWHGADFDFSASVSGIDSRIRGGWQGNRLHYAMDSYAEMELELAPTRLATLTIHGSINSQHAVQLQNEVLLGVSAVLDHTYHQMPSLHASAVERGGEAILFMGESGRGKSTLARELNGHGGLFSLSDDMCLVDPANVEISANTPQLKIEHYYYPAARNRARFPIKAIVIVEEPNDEVFLAEGSTPENLLALMRHTACVRLMPSKMQAHLLSIYGTKLAKLPIYRLHYPRKMDIFPRIATLLEQRLFQ